MYNATMTNMTNPVPTAITAYIQKFVNASSENKVHKFNIC